MGEFNTVEILVDLVENVKVPFGEWLPDLPAMENPGAIEALNVIPSENSYIPWGDHTPNGDTLPYDARGAAAIYTDETHLNVYVGVFDGIFARQNTFTRLYTSPINLADEFAWQFVPFGSNVVAIHPQIPPVAGAVGGTGPFTPLGGSPPTARTGARIKDFLVLGNFALDPDSGGSDPYPARVRWSGFNNIDAPWITDPATQSDFQDMPSEGGPVIAITGRESGTIFQARTISRMNYEGPPTIFSFETVEENRGAIARDAVVDLGQLVFFIADDGFFVWNGTNSTPIGDNKVNKYFFNKLNYPARSRIAAAADFNNKCIHWAFPTDDYQLKEIITYSLKENRWSHAEMTLEWLFNSGLPSFSLDTLVGNLDTDFSVSFDDLIYRGGGHSILAAFDSAHKYGFFTGANLAVTIDTSEFSGPDGRRLDITNVRPLVDLTGRTATVQIATRDQLFGDPLVWSAAVGQELDGTCPVMADGRLARVRLNIPAGSFWLNAQGLEVWRKATGRV